MYNEGISQEGEIIALGEKFAILEHSGSSYKYNGESLGRGYDATRQFLKENSKSPRRDPRQDQRQAERGVEIDL